MNLKTNPRLAPLSGAIWCPGVSGEGAASGSEWSPGCAQCLPCAWHGCAGSTVLFGQEGREEEPPHPNPGSQFFGAGEQRGITAPSNPGSQLCSAACEVLSAADFWFSSLLWSHPGVITCSAILSWELLHCGWWPGQFPFLEKFSCYLYITSWKISYGNYLLFCQTSVWWKRTWEVYLPQEQYFQMTCKKPQTYFEFNAISSLCLCRFCSENV